MRRMVSVMAVAILFSPATGLAQEKNVYRIGIPRSLFRDVPAALVSFAGEPFKAVMKSQTGLDGEVIVDPDTMNIARDLAAGRLQLGVFQGHEFAWAREKYPDLTPIVCAVPRPRDVQAYVLVRHDFKANHLGDLKGRRLAMPTTTRDYVRLFFDRRKSEELGAGSFGSIEKTATVHDAIYQVIEGEADVTVADHAAWNYFQKLHPGASTNLRVLSRSEQFPPTVIAFQKGNLSDHAVARLRDGLLTAHESPRSSKVMNLIKVEKFDHPPSTFEESLRACLKSYPSPVGGKSK